MSETVTEDRVKVLISESEKVQDDKYVDRKEDIRRHKEVEKDVKRLEEHDGIIFTKFDNLNKFLYSIMGGIIVQLLIMIIGIVVMYIQK